MATPQIPIENAGLLYVNNLQVAAGVLNADLLSTATLVISAGQARDSTNVNDIELENSVILNTTLSGVVNGLDQGALAVTTKYAVFVIGDSTSHNDTGTLLSTSFTNPLLPFGYDMFRRIGTVLSNDTGTRLLNFHQRGNGSLRSTYYAVPLATTAIVLNDANFQPILLTTWVPITAIKAQILSVLTSDAGATRTVKYSADASTTIGRAATAGEVIQSSPASTATSSSLIVPISSAGGVQSIQCAVPNGGTAGLTLAVSVQGFEDAL